MKESEFLEFAAKAAGIKIQYSENYGDFSIGEPYSREEVRWNPLTDDGDALRLAVKLKMQITPPEHSSRGIWAIWDKRHQRIDPYAETRLAIVRAAAEIGKSL